MSQENVEIVRRIVQAFLAGVESRDFSSAWDSGAAVADDVEWVAAPEFTEQRSFRGRDGFVEFMRRWTEDFEEYSIHFERLIDAGGNQVVGFFTQSAIGKGSGVRVEQPYFIVYDVEGRQLVRMRAYLDRDQALEAAGLSE